VGLALVLESVIRLRVKIGVGIAGQGQGLIRNYAVSDPGEKESFSAIWPELVENQPI